ncbi:MAG: MMPL family transporter [Cellvibrionaceae bacterium]
MNNQFTLNLIHKVQAIIFRPWLAILWLFIIVGSGVWTVSTTVSERTFDTSILALLPEDDQKQTLAEKISKEHLTATARDSLIFLIGHENKTIGEEGASLFLKQLERSGEFNVVRGQVSEAETEKFKTFFEPYRHVLVSSDDQQYYTEWTEAESVSTERDKNPLVKNALSKLYSPMATLVAPSLIEDPLQTFFNWQLSAVPKTEFKLQNGWLTRRVEGVTFRLITVDLLDNPFNMRYQKIVENVIQDAEEGLPVGSRILKSGMLFHAAHGARQAQSEVSTIGLGSLAGIALMLLYFFRSVRYVIVAFIPIATGCLFALTISLLVFKELHLITLAFGAGLVGVAIDYSLHYLCTTKDAQTFDFTSDKKCRAILKIFPGITLGLISSAIAYAAQGISPFPGLRQMALFSVLGLFGAWMTVVCWLPRLPLPRHKDESLSESTKFIRTTTWMLNKWPNIDNKKVRISLILIVLVSIYQAVDLNFDDDLRKLQTSPQSMLDEEADVQRLAQSINTAQYFVVTGDSEQQLLQREENLRKDLDDLLAAHKISDYHAVSKLVPSLSRQNRNATFAENVIYSREGLANEFAQAIESPSSSLKMKDAFHQIKDNRLSIDEWIDSAAGGLQQYLWIGKRDSHYYSIIALAGISDTKSLNSLQRLTQLDKGLQFVDSVSSITHVLERNRQSLLKWLMIAYGIVALILFSRYRFKVWRIVAVPAVASLMALAILAAGGFVVNIFNLLALLLVLGIGLDASIFLRESRRNIHTWVAVTLAAITTLLAFGLLALSQTPVLHQFGITVLLGIIGVWLLAPCFIENPKESNDKD